MVIVTKPKASAEEITAIETRITTEGLQPHKIVGEALVIIGVIGTPSEDFREQMAVFPGVERVVRIGKPYTMAGRGDSRSDTTIEVKGASIGGGDGVTIMAGPCTIENRDQLMSTADTVKLHGATILRGGAWKPRTSPYSFQGMKEEGLELLQEAGLRTGLPTITEVMEPDLVEKVAEYTDILQIGARNSQNFALLREAGASGIPVMVKRGPGATVEEWIMSAEYVMAEGNPNVMLCERGIKTFEPSTRNSLDINGIAMAKRLSHLPVICDPSHATGKWYLVEPATLAGIAAGADGVIIEVHPTPDHALCDGPQSLTFGNYENLVKKIRAIATAVGRPVKDLTDITSQLSQ